MKQRNKLYIGYVVFLVCLFIPLVGSANYSGVNSQMPALKRYSEKNFFATNNVSEKVVNVNPADALVNFLPASKAPPVLNGNMVGQALASNASLLNWNKPTADLEIEKIIVYRITIADENGLPTPSVGTEVELAGNSTHYVDSDVETGVTYEYAIKAVDIEGNESGVSNVVAVMTDESDDEVHNADRVVGEVTASSATLNIEHLSSHETLYEYKVLGFYTGLFDDGGLSWENISDKNTYFEEVNVDLNAGFLHHFVVVPLNLAGNILGTGDIITVVAPPHAPGNLQAIEISYDFVTLQWENTNDLENIPESVVTEIYRYDSWSDNPDDLEFLMSIDERGAVKSTDVEVEFDQEYTYAVVTRVGADNGSEFSNMVEVITLLPEVGNLQSGERGTNSIEITWENAINDLAIVDDRGIVHDIYRDGTLITDEGVSGNDNAFIDDGLDALTSYKYHIVTRSNNNNSNPSSTLEVTTRPHEPRNLRATNIATNSVTLEWDDLNITDDVAYLIRRDDGKDVVIHENIFVDPRLTAISSHNYKVVIRVGEDNYSMPSSIDVTTRPHAPQNLTVTEVTTNSVGLKWENINDLSGVIGEVVNEIYRDGVYLDEVAGSDKTFTDSTVTQGNTYTYTIMARVGTDNMSVASDGVTVKIELLAVPPVANLRAMDVQVAEVEITWDNTIDGSILAEKDVFHKVYRDNNELDVVYGRENSYRDTTVEALTDYEYHIVTLVAPDNATSVPSDVLKVTTLARLSAPSNLKATEVTISGAKLGWTNPNGNIANVQQDMYRDDTILKKDIGNVSEFTDTTALPGTPYKYKVVVRRGSEELASNTLLVTTLTRLNAPSGLRATEVTASGVKLEWTNPNSNIANVEQDMYRDGLLLSRNIGGDVSRFIDDTVLPIKQYKYKVVARRGSEMVESNDISVITPPKAPSDLRETGVTESTISLEWVNNNTLGLIIDNEIYRDGTLINTVGGLATSYIDRQVVAGRTYTYTVKARVGDDNRSVASNEVVIRANGLAPVGNVTIRVVGQEVIYTWDNVVNNLEEITHVLQVKYGDLILYQATLEGPMTSHTTLIPNPIKPDDVREILRVSNIVIISNRNDGSAISPPSTGVVIDSMMRETEGNEYGPSILDLLTDISGVTESDDYEMNRDDGYPAGVGNDLFQFVADNESIFELLTSGEGNDDVPSIDENENNDPVLVLFVTNSQNSETNN